MQKFIKMLTESWHRMTQRYQMFELIGSSDFLNYQDTMLPNKSDCVLRTVFIYLTSISRTRCVSGNRSHTLLFIFSLMMNEWQVLQSPIFMALLAATTCSLMLSGGPGGQNVLQLAPLLSPWI